MRWTRGPEAHPGHTVACQARQLLALTPLVRAAVKYAVARSRRVGSGGISVAMSVALHEIAEAVENLTPEVRARYEGKA